MTRTWTAALLLALAAAPSAAVNVELLSRVPPRRASETASGSSRAATISADGRYTVVVSEAVNLVAGMGDAPLGAYLFLHDRVAGTATRITRSSTSPLVHGGDALNAQISADGRFVAFESRATDEVDGQEDGNLAVDLFLWDRITGETELVSRSDADPARTANGDSTAPAVSADGRFVAFVSTATDLVDGIQLSNPGIPRFHVFLWDRTTGEVQVVTRSAEVPGRFADDSSQLPSISADGRFVAFLSVATNLVAGQTDRAQSLDAFLWDRVTGQTVLVSRAAGNPRAAANRSSFEALVSANGRFVALLSSATNMVPGQRGGGANVFLWNRETGETSLVSHARTGNGPALRGQTDLAAVSADGSHVLFSSDARNLFTGPGQGLRPVNVFLWSRASGRNTLVTPGGNADSVATGLSADGVWIVFESEATNLVAGVTDRNLGQSDVFLANGRSGRITLLSASGESPATTADGESRSSLISADGRWAAYTSTAPDLEAGVRDANHLTDAVLADREGDHSIVSVHPPGLASSTSQAESYTQSIDASGRFVVFVSDANAGDLVPGARDRNRFGVDVFLYDRELRTLTLVTRSATDPGATADASSPEARISADGRWVAFTSNATDLVPGQTTPPGSNVFLWDRTTGQTILASRSIASPTTGGNAVSNSPGISDDGSVVAFQSFASDLVPGQTESPFPNADIFLFDRTTGTVSLVSRAAGSETVAGNGNSINPEISADGRIVSYSSVATNLVAGVTDPEEDGEPDPDVFLFDRTTGTTTLASRTTAPAPTAGGGVAFALSGNGRFVVFESRAVDLVPGQTDRPNTSDLFLFDRIAGTTVLVTHEAGSPTAAAAAGASQADISADGRFIAFASLAGNLVAGQVDDPFSLDIFVLDRETGAVEMVSRAAGTVATAGPGGSATPVISADGRSVAFVSNRLDLIPGLTGPQAVLDLFVHDRPTGTTTLVSHVFGNPARLSSGITFFHLLNANGSVVAFTSTAPDLVLRDFNRSVGLFPDAFAAAIP
jgi:Tol biopolymer transport system component